MKAVVFDLDGTLIDSTDAIVDSFLHTFAVLGEPAPSRDAIIRTISAPLEEQFRSVGAAQAAEAPAIYREHYNREAPDKTVLLPGVENSLIRLSEAGIRLAIATSKRRTSAEPLLAHLGIGHFFEFCVGPEDVTHPKPHPESIHLLLDQLNLSPASIVFVGDTEYDVKAAQAANVRSLAVATGYATRDELELLDPEAVFDDMESLTNYLMK